MHSEQCRLENTYLFSVLVNCWVLFLHLTSAFISFYPKWNIFFFSPKLQRRFLWGTGRKTYHFNEYPRNISLSPSVALSVCLAYTASRILPDCIIWAARWHFLRPETISWISWILTVAKLVPWEENASDEPLSRSMTMNGFRNLQGILSYPKYPQHERRGSRLAPSCLPSPPPAHLPRWATYSMQPFPMSV